MACHPTHGTSLAGQAVAKYQTLRLLMVKRLLFLVADPSSWPQSFGFDVQGETETCQMSFPPGFLLTVVQGSSGSERGDS
jgi:hypothetical protein